MAETDQQDIETNLPPRAGAGTLFGLRPADFLAALSGLLSGGMQISPGVHINPGAMLYPIAQGMEAGDQRARQDQIVKDLGAQYGDQKIPEFGMAMHLARQGFTKEAMALLAKGIGDRNLQQREDRKSALAGRAATTATSLLGNIEAPQITTLEPMGAGKTVLGDVPGGGELLENPPLPPVQSFQSAPRPRTTNEIIKGLAALPEESRGLASEKLFGTIKERSEKDAQRAQDILDARTAFAQLGGAAGLKTASPDALEAAALTMGTGSKFAAQLGLIAAHRRSGNEAAARAAADAATRQWQQGFRESESERHAREEAERLQLRKDALAQTQRHWEYLATERGNKVSAADQKNITLLAGLDNWHRQVTQAFEDMHTAGMLPTGIDVLSSTKAAARRWRLKEHDAIRVWNMLAPGIVGLDRAVLGDVAARIKDAYAGSLNIFAQPPTYEAGKKVLKTLGQQIDTGKQHLPEMLRAGRQAEGLGEAADIAPPRGGPSGGSSTPVVPGGTPSSGVTPGGVKYERVDVSPGPPMGAPGFTGTTNTVPRGSAPVGKVILQDANGNFSYWPANRAIPPGNKRVD